MLALCAIVSVPAAAATPTPTVETALGVMYVPLLRSVLVLLITFFSAPDSVLRTGHKRFLVVLESGWKRWTVLNFALSFDC